MIFIFLQIFPATSQSPLKLKVVRDRSQIIGGGGGGGWKIFLCTREYFGGLLQNYQINFDGYLVTRRNFSGATQNFSVGFLLCKGSIS